MLGTSSNAGKSWIVNALGAWLHRQGVNVALLLIIPAITRFLVANIMM